jgi:cytochrome c-type biogenesis protein
MAIVNVVFGLVVIVFGLFVLNLVKLPSLYRDRRLRLAPGRFGIWGAPLLGIAFGLGWTPCVGPWLASLYSIAANIPPAQAAGLFAIYSASLGLCFVATGMLFAYALRAFAFFQRHYRAVEVVSGVLLIIIGLLLVTQQWGRATAALMALAG